MTAVDEGLWITERPEKMGGGSFRKELLPVVDEGRKAAEADPDYGTENEDPTKPVRWKRIGPYSDHANAVEAKNRANSRYGKEFNGVFEGYSKAVQGDGKRAYLLIRFKPNRATEVGEGSE